MVHISASLGNSIPGEASFKRDISCSSPSFQAPTTSSSLPPFQQPPLTGTPPPSLQPGLPHPPSNLHSHAPLPSTVYAQSPPPSQAARHPQPVMVDMGQPHIHMHPPPPSNFGSNPVLHSYAPQTQAGAPYQPQTGNPNAHRIPASAFPPPRGLAPSGVSTQGQLLYRNPHPPPPGIHHARPPYPPPPASFVTISPPFAPFLRGSMDEAPPPSLPPPPPPPPPPLSPSPSPSSQVGELPVVKPQEMPDQEVMKDHDQDSNIINGSGNDSQLIGSVPVPSGHTSDKVCKVETEYSGKKKETPSLHSSPPTRPAEDVVHNIETLCKFMVNVGPQFENLARMKEVNNPSFSFLFGGEPGSAAAIGYDYFKWMKRKYRFESDNSELGFSIQASAQPQSSAGERKSLSPAESDMDMDDDASQSEVKQGIAELSKESNEEVMSQPVTEKFRPRSNITEGGMGEMPLPDFLLSSKSYFHNQERHDVDRSSAHHTSSVSNQAVPGMSIRSVQQPVSSTIEDSLTVNVPLSQYDGQGLEAATASIKGGSPFRLIQDYASDDSGGDDGKELIVRGTSDLASARNDLGTSFEKDDVNSCSPLLSKSALAAEKSNQSRIDTARADVVGSSQANKERADYFGGQKRFGRTLGKGTSKTSRHRDIDGDEKGPFNAQVGEFHREKYATKGSLLKVDEFGRMAKEGASSSDSEEMSYEKKYVRRGRSRSRSQSPQERKRRRSRSPWRWRERRSQSQSWSPRGHSRSKSPRAPPRHMGDHRRRGQGRPPECFNFLRGRCYRGASCRYLHHDMGRFKNKNEDYRNVSQDFDRHMRREESHGVRNLEKETAIQKERFPLDGKRQVLSGKADLLSSSIRDEDPIGQSSVDSMKKDGKHVFSSEQHQSKNTGEVDHEPASHEIFDLLPGSDHAGKLQESPDSRLMEDTDQKPSGDNHDVADDSLDDQGSSAPEAQKLPRGDHLDRPSLAENHTTLPQPAISVLPNESEPPKLLPSQHPVSGLSVTQSVHTQSLMPAAQSQTVEIPVTTGYSKPGPVLMSYQNQVPGFAQSPSFLSGDSQLHQSQTHPPPFQVNPPYFPSYSQMLPRPSEGYRPQFTFHGQQSTAENTLRTSRTNILPQPSPADGFPTGRTSVTSNYHSVSTAPKPTADETARHLVAEKNSRSHIQQSAVYPGVEFPSQSNLTLDKRQVLHPTEERNLMNEFTQRPGLNETPHTVFSPSVIEGHQSVSSLDALHSVQEGGGVQPPEHNINSQGYGSLARDESAGGMSYSKQAPPSLQHQSGSSFLSNMGATGNNNPSRYPPILPESELRSHLPDVGLPKVSGPTHYNPFSSAFEQTATSSRFVSSAFGHENSSNIGSKYHSSFVHGHNLMSEHGLSNVASSPPSTEGKKMSFLERPGESSSTAQTGELIHNKPWQKSEEEVAAKQFSVGPPVSDQYDPLFDSIEPSSRVSKMISSSQEQDPAVHDTDIGSSIHLPADVEENNKHKVGASIGVQIDNDEFGETAPEAEVGAVENESPGSPVRSPGKSKKTKDSKSMKLLKIALANFVKEVLKPSWRQGNMSKEAFKTIVKKTVDKVSGSVSSHKLPKSQAKINHYVESSQRKLTKLVMGYVDKYVKM
ncbi:unnamed protein product [Spirodela intermedia]|uniref:Uncharacterized protein n=1 Tax=Spirodela intermedia TaxID=51605 RepID=A0A7I8IHL3_SPIIN|nr:unnamed protein product [Spirodela intermedia]CAA6657363.1 unnamed protein product [Spirodela intermedia]